METIRIEEPFKKKEFIDNYMLLYKIRMMKLRKSLIRFVIITIIILSLGLLLYFDENKSNPLIVMGIVFAFFTFIIYITRLKSKNMYWQKLNEIAERYEKLNLNFVYELSDDSIKYWDNQKHLDYKWEVFSSYSIYKNYLFLTVKDFGIDTFIFEKKDADNDEYERIVELVKIKLPYKEIK